MRSPRDGGRRGAAAALVVVTHLAVLMAVWQWRLATPQGKELPRSISIRLLPDPAERRVHRESATAAAGDAAEAADARVERAPALPSRMERPRAVEPVRSLVAPLPVTPETEAARRPPDGSAAAATSGARVGLDGAPSGAAGPAMSGSANASGLALTPGREVLRGSMANPAVSDPRSNSPRPTFEERFAMGLDPTLCLKEERLPDGTIRRSLKHAGQAQSTMSATHGARTAAVRVCP